MLPLALLFRTKSMSKSFKDTLEKRCGELKERGETIWFRH